jgi:hypothetical protein
MSEIEDKYQDFVAKRMGKVPSEYEIAYARQQPSGYCEAVIQRATNIEKYFELKREKNGRE